MRLIKTKSFELAAITKGSEKAEQLAICIPGRLDTKDYANFTSHIDFLANKGYFALAFDAPGTWDSLGGLDIYTTTNYIKAIHELTEYFGNKPTLLLGHSRGGAVSMLAAESNDAVSALAVINSSYGPPTPPGEEAVRRGYRIEQRDLPPGTSRTKDQKEFELPIAYFKDGSKYHPAEALKKCAMPKLLIHGTKDDFTEPAEVKEIYEEIPEPKMFHVIDSEHDYRLHPEAIEEVNRTLGQFLNKYELSQ